MMPSLPSAKSTKHGRLINTAKTCGAPFMPRSRQGGQCHLISSSSNAWAEHYERLLNVEFDWDPDHLSKEPLLEGPPIPITIDMVKRPSQR